MSGEPLSASVYAVLLAADDAGRAMADRLGTGTSDTAALHHLFVHGPTGPVDLGRALGMGSAAATMLADRLERAGHVERHPHPHDRRRRRLVPTERAEREVRQALDPLVSRLDAIEIGLNETERAVVASYLSDVLDAYQHYTADGDGVPTMAKDEPGRRTT